MILFGWLQMAKYCDSPFDGDEDTHDINLMNELSKQIFVASIALESAFNLPKDEAPKNKIIYDKKLSKCAKYCPIPNKMIVRCRKKRGCTFC